MRKSKIDKIEKIYGEKEIDGVREKKEKAEGVPKKFFQGLALKKLRFRIPPTLKFWRTAKFGMAEKKLSTEEVFHRRSPRVELRSSQVEAGTPVRLARRDSRLSLERDGKGKVGRMERVRRIWNFIFERWTRLKRWKRLALTAVVIVLVAGGIFMNNMFGIKAASYSWLQTDWSGGADTVNFPNHTNNQSGWTKFYSKDANVDVTTTPGDAKLTQATGTSLQTTDTGTGGDTPNAGGFNAWTKTNAYVSGTGTSASLALLKPTGATCAVNAECAGSWCKSSVCDSCGAGQNVVYSGVTYNTVIVGTQCWLAQNLNVGTKLASGSTMPSDPFDYSNIQKWCYNNDDSLCTSEGGFYTWAEAMGLAASCLTTDCSGSITFPRQGICPTGWHIPQDSEQNTLDQYLKTGTCNASRTGWDCDPAGTKLKTGGNSNMNVPLAGYRDTNGSFGYRTTGAYLWSSSQDSATNAWYRILGSSNATVNRYNYDKAFGLSVRCLKN